MHLKFQPLRETDLPLLREWLHTPHLQKWWRAETLTIEEVREKYMPRITHEDNATPFIVYIDQEPSGYIQYYRADTGDQTWWPDNPGPGVYGIDLFIAKEALLNKGIGTIMVMKFIDYLMEKPGVKQIRVDPAPDNRRAIRCYEKAGFIKKEMIDTPDGPALLMIMNRDNNNN